VGHPSSPGLYSRRKAEAKIHHLIVHRATCAEIKAVPSTHTHWTTGSKLEACCLDRAELEAWAVDETGIATEYCATCNPTNEIVADAGGPVHLSKLPSDILEYILEAALIHFEVQQPPYHLTVADIAACFGKTPGQISPVLHRLVDGGFVTVQGHAGTAAAIPPKRIVLPTIAALRTLGAFRSESDSTIQDELAKLKPD
jgi:hypothetical protein